MTKSRLCLATLVFGAAAAGWTTGIVAQEKPLPATREPRVPKVPNPPKGPPPNPSVRELIEIIRRRAGGQQILERARRAGARIPSSVSSNVYDVSSLRSISGGPSVREFVPGNSPPSTAQLITGKVSRNLQSVSVAGLGYIYAQAYYPIYATTDPAIWGPLDRSTWDLEFSPVGSIYTAKSFVLITFRPQATGWYLINVIASGNVPAQLWKYSGTPAGYTLFQAFTPPGSYAYSSYPVLLNLASGSHAFSWVPLERFAYVSEVSVIKF